MRSRIAMLALLLAGISSVSVWSDGSGSFDQEAPPDDCGTPLVITAMGLSPTTLETTIVNPGTELANGQFIPTVSMGGATFTFAVSLEVAAGSAVDVEIVFPDVFALTAFTLSGCEGTGITEAPDPILVNIQAQDEEEQDDQEG